MDTFLFAKINNMTKGINMIKRAMQVVAAVFLGGVISIAGAGALRLFFLPPGTDSGIKTCNREDPAEKCLTDVEINKITAVMFDEPLKKVEVQEKLKDQGYAPNLVRIFTLHRAIALDKAEKSAPFVLFGNTRDDTDTWWNKPLGREFNYPAIFKDTIIERGRNNFNQRLKGVDLNQPGNSF